MERFELEKVFKISEVAVWMRCSRATVYRLLKAGELKSIKVSGSRLITEGQLKEFIEERVRQSQVEPSW